MHFESHKTCVKKLVFGGIFLIPGISFHSEVLRTRVREHSVLDSLLESLALIRPFWRVYWKSFQNLVISHIPGEFLKTDSIGSELEINLFLKGTSYLEIDEEFLMF